MNNAERKFLFNRALLCCPLPPFAPHMFECDIDFNSVDLGERNGIAVAPHFIKTLSPRAMSEKTAFFFNTQQMCKCDSSFNIDSKSIPLTATSGRLAFYVCKQQISHTVMLHATKVSVPQRSMFRKYFCIKLLLPIVYVRTCEILVVTHFTISSCP